MSEDQRVTKSSSYRADIQGLRAIAVILVLLFHFETRIRGGYLGVDMFFVISGFVIATSTLREVDLTNHFSLGGFLHRRIRRLLPGMAAMTITTSVLSMLLLSPFGPQKETAKMLVSAATYSSNFILMPQSYFSLDPKANPLSHLWSLAVEEQFYFLWPIAIIGFVGLRKRLFGQLFKVMVWVSGLVVVVTSCWFFLMCSKYGSRINDQWWFRPLIERNITPEHFAFYSPFTRAWEFVVGVLVALLLRLKIISHVLKAGSIFTFGGALMVWLGLSWATKFPEIQHEGNYGTNTSATIAVVIGTGLLIFGGLNDRLLSRLISVKPLTLIGDYSYSIYLWHWPIWVLLITTFKQPTNMVVFAFVLSLGFGWLQFRLIEEPIRARKKLSSARTLHFVGAFCLVTLVGFALMSYTTPKIGMHLASRMPGELSLHIVEKTCDGSVLEVGTAQSCAYESANNNGWAVLVGDSTAKSLSDGFVKASNSQGLNSYIFSFPGCAFQLFDSPFTATDQCVEWRTDVFTALQQIQPKVILIANLNSLYVKEPLLGWSPEDTQLIWGSELGRTLSGLSRLNTQVLIVQPPPRFNYDLRYDLSLLWPNSVKESRGDVVSRRENINEIEENAIVGFDFVRPILNFTDEFCNADICDPKISNKFMFEDNDHLSVDGSIFVSSVIERAISEALAR
jgi:peptidoglycan/LPS O-acetylase OafA/YrhL